MPSDLVDGLVAQLDSLHDAGFGDVDCLWKGRAQALLYGRRRG